MTSKIVVNNIEADAGVSTVTFASEVTAPTFNGNITGTAATFTTGTFSGNVDIAGALTYEDVTNVDSVGIITARSGIHVTGGNVGIGTDNPGAKTHIDSTTSNTPLVVEASQNNRSRIVFRNNVETGTECNIELFDDDLRFVTNSGERLRIDVNGKLLQGKTETKGSTGENVPTFCTEIANTNNPNVLEIANNGTNTNNSYSALALVRSDGTSVNSHTAVDSGDKIGEVCYIGADGADRFNTAAAIAAFANADFTANNCPANLVFYTNGGAATATERLRIDSAGMVGINMTPGTAGNSTYMLQMYNAGSQCYMSIGNGTSGNGPLNGLVMGISNAAHYIQGRENLPMIFATNDTERFRIASDGQATFDKGAVGGANQVIARFQAESSRRLDVVWHDSGSLLGFDLPGSHSYIFKTSGTERLRITNNGNISIASGGSLSVNDSNNNASGQASTTGAINCNLIRPYNNSNSSWNGVYFLSRNAVGGGAKSVGIVETGLRVGSFTSDLSATERIKLGTNGVITADTNTTDGVIANLRNDEVSFQIGVWGAGSSYPRQCTINATRQDGGTYPWLRLAGQDGIHFCSDFNNIRGNLNAYGEWRIGTSSGNLYSTDQVHSIGNLNFGVTSNLARLVMQERQSNWIAFKDGSSNHYGTISRSGSNVSYGGQTSDYRIKENVVGVSTGIDMVKQLRPVHFNYTADSGFSEEERSVVEIGFIAHEFSEVCPHGVIGEKDAYEILGDCVDDTTGETTQLLVPESQAKDGETWTETSREPKYQQIDFSKAVPVLTAALKEAIAKIETLEAKVAVLEGS